MSNEMIISIMAVITAYVSYFKAFEIIPTKYLPLVSLVMAFIFLLVPSNILDILMYASMIGLGATGFYHATQNNTDKGA